MMQQRLWREHHERFHVRRTHLSAQDVEVLRGRRRLNQDKVCACRHRGSSATTHVANPVPAVNFAARAKVRDDVVPHAARRRRRRRF